MKVTRTDECPCTTTVDDLEVGDLFRWESKPDVFMVVHLPAMKHHASRRTAIERRAILCMEKGIVSKGWPPSYIERKPVIKLKGELVVSEDKS